MIHEHLGVDLQHQSLRNTAGHFDVMTQILPLEAPAVSFVTNFLKVHASSADQQPGWVSVCRNSLQNSIPSCSSRLCTAGRYSSNCFIYRLPDTLWEQRTRSEVGGSLGSITQSKTIDKQIQKNMYTILILVWKGVLKSEKSIQNFVLDVHKQSAKSPAHRRYNLSTGA